MLMQNIWYMVNMAFATKVVAYYEKYYVKNRGQILKAIVAMNKGLKKHIFEL